MKILIINGPNINLVGMREPDIYGNVSFELFCDSNLRPLLPSLEAEAEEDIRLDCFQSNCEGDIVTRIQQAAYGPDEERADALIINAGAYTHYSLAIADALRAAGLPAVEVHISNIYAREPERHKSLISPCVCGQIAGLGLDGYRLALRWLVNHESLRK
ncbi:MAG: 3-dehydroquinate dehydratase [Bacteroidales bacterium]|nr:3-dehydroquinate dehydratase [Bacteroidales bacterium]MBD5211553.1 3-dehydroquinate dehydratase [Bacteroidales bacterium]